MATGTVKFFNTQKGYGFIKPDDGAKDVFVHITAVQTAGLKGLKDFPLLTGNLTFADDGSRQGGGFVIVEPTGDGGAFVLKDELKG